METENKIQAVPDFEAEHSQSLCEIRFDCIVTMFESGSRIIKGGMFIPEKRMTPQWFKSQHKITLGGIRNCDEYTLGRRLKEMMHQMDEHIRRYENGTNY